MRKSRRALERVYVLRFLWFVETQRGSPVVILASIAVAATTGALVAIGKRLGSAGDAFAAIGDLIAPDSIVAGVGVHVVAVVGWTLVFLWLTRRVGWSVAWAATAVGAAELVLSQFIAGASGRGIGTIVPLGDRVVLALVLALSLVVGMRFAFSTLRNA